MPVSPGQPFENVNRCIAARDNGEPNDRLAVFGPLGEHLVVVTRMIRDLESESGRVILHEPSLESLESHAANRRRAGSDA